MINKLSFYKNSVSRMHSYVKYKIKILSAEVYIIIIIVTSFAPISSKIKLSGATKPGD